MHLERKGKVDLIKLFLQTSTSFQGRCRTGLPRLNRRTGPNAVNFIPLPDRGGHRLGRKGDTDDIASLAQRLD